MPAALCNSYLFQIWCVQTTLGSFRCGQAAASQSANKSDSDNGVVHWATFCANGGECACSFVFFRQGIVTRNNPSISRSINQSINQPRNIQLKQRSGDRIEHYQFLLMVFVNDQLILTCVMVSSVPFKTRRGEPKGRSSKPQCQEERLPWTTNLQQRLLHTANSVLMYHIMSHIECNNPLVKKFSKKHGEYRLQAVPFFGGKYRVPLNGYTARTVLFGMVLVEIVQALFTIFPCI